MKNDKDNINCIIQGSEEVIESPMLTGFEGFDAGKFNYIDNPVVRTRPSKSTMDTRLLSFMLHVGEENRKELKKLMLELAYSEELTPEQMMEKYFKSVEGWENFGKSTVNLPSRPKTEGS